MTLLIRYRGMLVDEAYFVPEVTDCKQANTGFQGLNEINSEPGGMMDFEEDQSRHKRRRHLMS